MGQEQKDIAQQEVEEKFHLEKANKQQEDALMELFQDFVDEFTSQCCSESVHEGIAARRRAEDESGICFPCKHEFMQYDVYVLLLRSWKARKQELRQALADWGEAQISEVEEEEFE